MFGPGKPEGVTMITLLGVLVPLLFGITGLAVLTWIVVIFRQLPENAPKLWALITKITGPIFNVAPAQKDIEKSDPATRLVVGGIIPLIFWILIVLPMVIFPIVLILFPLLGIPWSYLLPPVP
jgi:hypothetical protein